MTLLGKAEGFGSNKEGASGVRVDCNYGIGYWMARTDEELSGTIIAFSWNQASTKVSERLIEGREKN